MAKGSMKLWSWWVPRCYGDSLRPTGLYTGSVRLVIAILK
jgi:hypothetical protein